MSMYHLAVVAVIATMMLLLLLALRFRRRPCYAYRPILTRAEVEFFRRLVSANDGGFVFRQVSMGALLEPLARTDAARLTAFRRISQKRVDYAVYTEDLSLICVVELDDHTHDSARASHRDQERDQMLRSAGIRTVRWDVRRKPSVAEIRDRVSELRGPTRACHSYA